MNFGCKWVDCCNCNWHLIIKCVPCQQYVCLLTFFIFILYFILYKCWLASFTSIDIIYPHSWWLNKCSPSYSVELPLSVSFSLLMTPCMSKKSKNIGHCLVGIVLCSAKGEFSTLSTQELLLIDLGHDLTPLKIQWWRIQYQWRSWWHIRWRWTFKRFACAWCYQYPTSQWPSQIPWYHPLLPWPWRS